jgi:hypothetical protein
VSNSGIFISGVEPSGSVARELVLEFEHLSRYSDGLDGWGSIPGILKIFLFSIAFRPALGPTQSPIQLASEALFPGEKRQGREADHSPQFSAEIMNGGALPSLSHTFSWRDGSLITHRDNFTFYVQENVRKPRFLIIPLTVSVCTKCYRL